MPITAELTTLGYVLDPQRHRVLLVHRSAREDDEQLGKYNGLGGKMEPGEHIIAAMKRELREEANIEATELTLRGTISWPGFNGRDVFGFVFLISSFSGEIPASNEEGELAWHDIGTIMDLPMWEGDRHFLPLVFDPEIAQFHAVLPYDGPRCIGFEVETIPVPGQG